VLLSVQGLSKRFGSNVVLRDVDLHIRPGEIVALMGPNGSGKSTLIKILDGVYKRDAGTVRAFGRDISDFGGLRQAGVIHQDLGLVDQLSIAENLRLGRGGRFVNRFADARAAAAALAAVGMSEVSAKTAVGNLSPAQKAMLAVARQLDTGARLLIIDETTSTMSERESEWLLDHLRERADSFGTAVLIVSHRLREIQKLADRVVVLVDGRVVANDPVEEFRRDPQRVVKLFTGTVAPAADEPGAASPAGPRAGDAGPVLSLDNVSVGTLSGVDLELFPGQVLGLTGSLGSSLHELALVLAGREKARQGSCVLRDGEKVALVPPQRETQSTFPELSIADNMTLTSLRTLRNRLGLLSSTAQKSRSSDLADELSLHPRDTSLPIGVLSGGNQQKVIFARAVMQGATVFILCEPTRGVDVLTRHEIYRLIRAKAREGAAVAVFSSDIEDILSVCEIVRPVGDTSVGPAHSVQALSAGELERLL
jgi:ribose transport system ATP-binding protein